MKLPSDIAELLKRKFKKGHREWLKAAVINGPGEAWPLEISLGIPTEQDALKQPDAVRSWISAWRSPNRKFAGSLVWSERRWRSLGTQNIPDRLLLQSPDDIAVWAGESARWLRAVNRFKSFVQRWPVLLETLPRHFGVLADYGESDFLNLSQMLTWICANPGSNLYIRQIPLGGIDSKWLESRKGLVSDLVALIRGEGAGGDFFVRCGLKPQPQHIRFRILDAGLRRQVGGLGDICAPVEEIAELNLNPAYVFIVENIQTGLAFDDLKCSVVIMGLGYGVDVLEKIPWARPARCIYWGDIDTHGLAILNRARSYLPKLEAALMDEATLLSHRELWVEEKNQHAASELPLLTNSEQKLYRALKSNLWGQHIRLEQERIRWDIAQAALARFVE